MAAANAIGKVTYRRGAWPRVRIVSGGMKAEENRRSEIPSSSRGLLPALPQKHFLLLRLLSSSLLFLESEFEFGHGRRRR